jgi:hypothetical protein
MGVYNIYNWTESGGSRLTLRERDVEAGSKEEALVKVLDVDESEISRTGGFVQSGTVHQVVIPVSEMDSFTIK